MDSSRLALRVEDAAELLSISRSKCYDLVRRGELPAVRLGGTSVRIPLDALRRLIDEAASAPERTDPQPTAH